MRTNHIRMLDGPNIWSQHRMLEVDLSKVDFDPDSLTLATQRLSAIWEQADSVLPPSEFPCLTWPAKPLNEAQIIVSLTLNLQRRVNLGVRLGHLRNDDTRPQDVRIAISRDEVRVAIEIVEETVGRRAWQLACDLWRAAQTGVPFDLARQLSELKELAFQVCLGQTTGAIVEVAKARGIPVIRLDDESLVQLGHGARQRRLQTAISDHSGFSAESVSRDKALTKSLLKRVGIPVPEGRAATDEDDAWKAACEVGLPVVVKPRDADYGQGVSLKMTSREEVITAYRAARKYRDDVIVERFLEGAHHRVMVVNSQVVAAVRFDRAVVVGDGKRTVAELIDEMNHDPRRGARDDSTRPWFLMEIDEETLRVLQLQGHGLDSRPLVGEQVVLRLEPRIGWGGGVVDVTDEIHSSVATTVIDAVSMVGLDIAGVDLIANDLTRPLAEQNGGILEVNAGPAILMHLRPFSDPPRPVPEAIVSFMFPQPEQARIPLVSVCGDDRDNTVVTQIAEIMRSTDPIVGRATRNGVFVDDRCLSRKRSDNVQGTQMLLLHPKVQSAVIDVSLDQICAEGLSFDRCHVAVILGMDSGGAVIQPIVNDDDRKALQVLFDTTRVSGVTIVNLDDPRIADLALERGSNVIAISTRSNHPALETVKKAGWRCVVSLHNAVLLANGSHEHVLFPLGRSDSCHPSKRQSAISILATIATGWALGIPLERLRQELVGSSFSVIHPETHYGFTDSSTRNPLASGNGSVMSFMTGCEDAQLLQVMAKENRNHNALDRVGVLGWMGAE